ncbi:glycosyltransferase [Candidatus Formimonas warabiya]|uniref:Glycosyl transferase n=1 Tax=Formimonas warabiya TaxID=1761012 RepID=A0A3G1KX65_FORW1|nr:glycosyltransferase [Candidatus Formimonas warabiya]ATW26959.1 glycosyl transferase [Candidatus Formimonas warabiya]
MVPPLLSYITFNRLGLTVQNLPAILQSTDDFEMHIIDNNSYDGTWDYLQSVQDVRIKSKTRVQVNSGQIYALNLNLTHRRPDQYFIAVDNDVHIETKDWISRFMKVFEEFPEVGLLGVQRGYPYPQDLPPVTPQLKNGALYLELDKNSVDPNGAFLPGCCQCLRPELIKEIGYWSEENGFGDIELCFRVSHFTSFKVGFVPSISIRMPQTIECHNCPYESQCHLDKYRNTCFTIYEKLYKNHEFVKKFNWKLIETFKDMKTGARPVYCASALDGNALANHIFNLNWALENFRFYIDNAN